MEAFEHLRYVTKIPYVGPISRGLKVKLATTLLVAVRFNQTQLTENLTMQ